jgi:hypothetical protein
LLYAISPLFLGLAMILILKKKKSR